MFQLCSQSDTKRYLSLMTEGRYIGVSVEKKSRRYGTEEKQEHSPCLSKTRGTLMGILGYRLKGTARRKEGCTAGMYLSQREECS